MSLKDDVLEAIREAAGSDHEIDFDTPLIGAVSSLDSMKLVEVCLSLEDLALDHDFDFDWTSEVAMSKSRSIFRTAGTLVGEFMRQSQSEAT
jgi:hypothetical protein